MPISEYEAFDTWHPEDEEVASLDSEDADNDPIFCPRTGRYVELGENGGG